MVVCVHLSRLTVRIESMGMRGQLKSRGGLSDMVAAGLRERSMVKNRKLRVPSQISSDSCGHPYESKLSISCVAMASGNHKQL